MPKHAGGRPSKYSEAYIYALKDPDTGDVRYIGKSIRPSRRYLEHLSLAPVENTPKAKWVAGLVAAGKRPVMEIIARSADWEVDEQKYIEAYSKTCNLLNVAPGGLAICAAGSKTGPREKNLFREVSQRVGRIISDYRESGDVATVAELMGHLHTARKLYRRAANAGASAQFNKGLRRLLPNGVPN